MVEGGRLSAGSWKAASGGASLIGLGVITVAGGYNWDIVAFRHPYRPCNQRGKVIYNIPYFFCGA